MITNPKPLTPKARRQRAAASTDRQIGGRGKIAKIYDCIVQSWAEKGVAITAREVSERTGFDLIFVMSRVSMLHAAGRIRVVGYIPDPTGRSKRGVCSYGPSFATPDGVTGPPTAALRSLPAARAQIDVLLQRAYAPGAGIVALLQEMKGACDHETQAHYAQGWNDAIALATEIARTVEEMRAVHAARSAGVGGCGA